MAHYDRNSGSHISGMVAQACRTGGSLEHRLFTRPRSFGKTLNMSMLKSFFEIGTDKTLFDGLYISGNKELCDEYMGKYPVIFLSLKDVEGLEFSSAKRMLCVVIEREINRHYYLKTSDALNDVDRSLFTKMLHGQADNIEDSIRMLSKLLYKHYGQKAVITHRRVRCSA